MPTRSGIFRAAVHVAAADRASPFVRVLEERADGSRCVVGAELVVGLAPGPTEVERRRRPGRHEVDLFPGVLPDICDDEVAGCRVEGEFPGVAQSVGPDLWTAAAVRVRVARGDRVGTASAWRRGVDPQQLAEQGVERLAVAVGRVAGPAVAGAAAVAGADPEHPVRTGDDVAAVVVGLGLVDREDFSAVVPIGGAVGAHRVGVHPRVAVAVRVVHVERLPVGGEGQPEQSLLAARGESVTQVDDGPIVENARSNRAHSAGPLRDVERVVAPANCQRRRRVEGRDPVEGETGIARVGRWRRGRRHHGAGGGARAGRGARTRLGAAAGSAARGREERHDDEGDDWARSASEHRWTLPRRAAARRSPTLGVVKYVVLVPDGCADEPNAELDGRTPLEVAAHAAPPGAGVAQRGRSGRGDPRRAAAGERRRQHVDPRLRPGPLPHRSGADRGRGDGHRPRSRRGGLPLQPRHHRRRRDDGRLRRGPHHQRAEPPDRRRARRASWVAVATACASTRASSTATCAWCRPTGPTRTASRPTTSPVGPAVWPTGPAATRAAVPDGRVRSRSCAAAAAEVDSVATQIWLWGQGVARSCPTSPTATASTVGCSSAVDLVRGLGVLAGIEVVDVPGATAGFDNDYVAPADGLYRLVGRPRLLPAARRGDRRGRSPEDATAEGRRRSSLGRRDASGRSLAALTATAAPDAADARPRDAVRSHDPHVGPGARTCCFDSHASTVAGGHYTETGRGRPSRWWPPTTSSPDGRLVA